MTDSTNTSKASQATEEAYQTLFNLYMETFRANHLNLFGEERHTDMGKSRIRAMMGSEGFPTDLSVPNDVLYTATPEQKAYLQNVWAPEALGQTATTKAEPLLPKQVENWIAGIFGSDQTITETVQAEVATTLEQLNGTEKKPSSPATDTSLIATHAADSTPKAERVKMTVVGSTPVAIADVVKPLDGKLIIPEFATPKPNPARVVYDPANGVVPTDAALAANSPTDPAAPKTPDWLTAEQFDKRDPDQLLELQKALNTLSYKGENGKTLVEDGLWGKNTRHALTRFQEANGLSANGIVDDKTRAKLAETLTNIKAAKAAVAQLPNLEGLKQRPDGWQPLPQAKPVEAMDGLIERPEGWQALPQAKPVTAPASAIPAETTPTAIETTLRPPSVEELEPIYSNAPRNKAETENFHKTHGFLRSVGIISDHAAGSDSVAIGPMNKQWGNQLKAATARYQTELNKHLPKDQQITVDGLLGNQTIQATQAVEQANPDLSMKKILGIKPQGLLPIGTDKAPLLKVIPPEVLREQTPLLSVTPPEDLKASYPQLPVISPEALLASFKPLPVTSPKKAIAESEKLEVTTPKEVIAQTDLLQIVVPSSDTVKAQRR